MEPLPFNGQINVENILILTDHIKIFAQKSGLRQESMYAGVQESSIKSLPQSEKINFSLIF